MNISRRGVLASGVGLVAIGGTEGVLSGMDKPPRAWRVSFVDCDEPIVEGYDGARFYATLLRSEAEAAERLLETECFAAGRQEYVSLDYDEFVVSVRTAVLPADKTVESVSYEFAGDVLKHVVRVVDAEDESQATDGMCHVVTTWELNGAESPERVELQVEGDG